MTFVTTIPEQSRQWRRSPLLGLLADKGELCSKFDGRIVAAAEPRSGHRYQATNMRNPGVGKGG